MTIKAELDIAMKETMKARDDLRLSVVRMVKSAVRNREIELKSELDDNAVIEVISTLAKQRRESIRLYNEGKRPELAEKEERELAFLLQFLPQQLTPDEIESIVKKSITESGATSAKDMGKVMKSITPLTAGKADGKYVSETVKRILSEL